MTGGAFTGGAYEAVMRSQLGMCVGGCQQPATDAHHRTARGMGGTSRAAVGRPHNGLPVCRSLHDWIEGHLPAALTLGYKTPTPDPGEPFWSPVFGVWQAWTLDADTWLVVTADVTDPHRIAAAAAFRHTPAGVLSWAS